MLYRRSLQLSDPLSLKLYPLKNCNSHFFLPWPLETTILLSASIGLIIFNTSFKCNHAVCPCVADLFHLAKGPQDSAMLSHVAKCPPFLRLNIISIPHYFIHSSTDEHLGCFHILFWIMPQWTGVCKYLFQILLWYFLDLYPEVWLLDHMVVLFKIFLRNLYTIFP